MANQPGGRIVAFLGELKRRRVYRVTVIYLVLAVGGLGNPYLIGPAAQVLLAGIFAL